MSETTLANFQKHIETKFILYNSLFSNLPYQEMSTISNLLELFKTEIQKGLHEGLSPVELVNNFFDKHLEQFKPNERNELLFKFIQFVERQIVLFDAIEDAAFDKINKTDGRGTLNHLFSSTGIAIKKEEVISHLENFKLKLVLTAHPTQFYSGEILGIITDLTKAFKNNDLDAINSLLLQLSRTPFFKKEKPTPFEEVWRLTWYLSNIFYDAIYRVHDRINKFVSDVERDSVFAVSVGFWPGGDRDGNPFVTHQTTLEAAAHIKRSILTSYHADLRKLRRKLTFRNVHQRVEAIWNKVGRTIDSEVDNYKSKAELINDLNSIADILKSEHESIFIADVHKLISKVKIFGFHFASLDIRQSRQKHHEAVIDLIGDKHAEHYLKLDEAGRIEFVENFDCTDIETELSDQTQEILKTIQAIATIQNENGEKATNRYIISNCSDVIDIKELMFLFRAANWQGPITLGIIPLFESVEDLENAPDVMTRLYSDPLYKSHLEGRSMRQVIMLGFSDGTKDGGYLTANWEIYKAKEKLSEVSANFGVKVAFFDGRGGPPARGGGNTHNFYASLGEKIARDEVQLTIQGQSISTSYGIRQSAKYNIEQLLSAGLRSYIRKEEMTLSSADCKLIEELSQLSKQAYFELKLHPQFLSYLEKYSPVKYLGRANIGSRPASRKQHKNLRYEDLRAITYVGAWYQLKQNAPGYFGLGSALKELKKQGRLDEAKQLVKSSGFFRALIENSMMSMVKTDFRMTAFIKTDPQFAELWKMIEAEFELSKALLLEITDCDTLMQHQTAGKASIEMRERIVLPLSVIQQYAMYHMRKAPDAETTPLYENMLIRTFYGITNAGRNSI